MRYHREARAQDMDDEDLSIKADLEGDTVVGQLDALADEVTGEKADEFDSTEVAFVTATGDLDEAATSVRLDASVPPAATSVHPPATSLAAVAAASERLAIERLPAVAATSERRDVERLPTLDAASDRLASADSVMEFLASADSAIERLASADSSIEFRAISEGHTPPFGTQRPSAVHRRPTADMRIDERDPDSVVVLGAPAGRAVTAEFWPPPGPVPAGTHGPRRQAQIFTAVKDESREWLDSDQVTVVPSPDDL